MLNHEEAHEKARCRDGEQQTNPIAGVESRPHQSPNEDERHSGAHELEHAARTVRLAVAAKYVRQRAGIERGMNIRGSLMHPQAPHMAGHSQINGPRLIRTACLTF
jgi:hypothetical protein